MADLPQQLHHGDSHPHRRPASCPGRRSASALERGPTVAERAAGPIAWLGQQAAGPACPRDPLRSVLGLETKKKGAGSRRGKGGGGRQARCRPGPVKPKLGLHGDTSLRFHLHAVVPMYDALAKGVESRARRVPQGGACRRLYLATTTAAAMRPRTHTYVCTYMSVPERRIGRHAHPRLGHEVGVGRAGPRRPTRSRNRLSHSPTPTQRGRSRHRMGLRAGKDGQMTSGQPRAAFAAAAWGAGGTAPRCPELRAGTADAARRSPRGVVQGGPVRRQSVRGTWPGDGLLVSATLLEREREAGVGLEAVALLRGASLFSLPRRDPAAWGGWSGHPPPSHAVAGDAAPFLVFGRTYMRMLLLEAPVMYALPAPCPEATGAFVRSINGSPLALPDPFLLPSALLEAGAERARAGKEAGRQAADGR
ncbi:hypothetical protein CDD83_3403 [Cordyceps sp. RAO-2017]|nr:hypothetical protein CDD83_3403 [Cordyceps sp. RAO-2017]